MLESFFYIPLGLILLYYGAEGLVSGASRLALGLGVSALSVGLTVVAFGTSAPELFVSLHAALSGMEDVALGNVVGSNICNIALILGVAAVLRPVEINARLIKWDMPVLIIASSWMLYALVNKNIGRVEGAICFLGLVAYLIFNLWEARREAEPVKEVIQGVVPEPGAVAGTQPAVHGPRPGRSCPGGQLVCAGRDCGGRICRVKSRVYRPDHRGRRHQPA